MSNDTEYLKHVSTVFQEASLPTIIDISLSGVSNDERNDRQEYLFSTTWKQNNYEISKTRKFITSHRLNIGNEKQSIENIPTFPIQYDGGLLEKISPSRKLKAVIKKQENTTTKKEEFILEVWSGIQIIQTLNLSSFDKHGTIHSDPVFSCLNWSDDESKLLYVAEKKKVKNIGFFERPPKKESKEDKEKQNEPATTMGEKYDYEESWGEMLTDVTNTVLVIINLNNETVEIVEGIPDGICPAQPQWSNENTLVFTGYQTKPIRLGLRVCENRESKIYLLKLNENGNETTSLSPMMVQEIADSNPRLSNNKEYIVFLRRQLSGTGDCHRGFDQLMMYNLKDESEKVIFAEGIFYSDKVVLFAHALPSHCWLSDDVHVALPNDHNGVHYTCIINTITGAIIQMFECTNLLSVESDLIFLSYMRLDSVSAIIKVVHFINNEFKVYQQPFIANNQFEYGKIVDQNNVVSHYMLQINAVNPTPLIILPHGGPHVMSGNGFRRDVLVLCKLGYAVLICNYRGSTGFTKDILKALGGNVGDMDVKDVQNFATKFLELKGEAIDKNNIFALGGSHGGFLGAHLVGQYPDFYRAAALLNPVIDIAAMSMVTDIPDWCYFEAGILYNQSVVPCAEDYKSMVEKSPIIYLKNVKAPVLLCIGGKDNRVPPSQGKGYFRLLKANNKVTKLLYYPEDSHSLASIETDGDVFVNVCKWFHNHTKK